MLPAAFAGPDSHVTACILFHIEVFRAKLLNDTSVVDVRGRIDWVVQLLMKDAPRRLLSLTVGCAKGCSGVLLTHLPAHIVTPGVTVRPENSPCHFSDL